jgi:hypothetical protein
MKRIAIFAAVHVAVFALAGLALAAEPQVSASPVYHSHVYPLPQLDVTTEFKIVKAEEVVPPAAVAVPAPAPAAAPAPAPAPIAAQPAADKPKAKRKAYRKPTRDPADPAVCVVKVPCIDWPTLD